MRRFTGTEWGIFVLALVFIVVGGNMTIHPTETEVTHEAYRWVHASVEHISKQGARVYGVLAILSGLGFLWLLFYKRGK